MTLADTKSAAVVLRSPADAVGEFRREIKFALPHADFGKFRSILEVNCRRVSYAKPTSKVVSLYFDDLSLSSCRQNLDGTSRRSKLRLRWYDEPLFSSSFFFEVKRRQHDALTKERFLFRSDEAFASRDVRDIVSGVVQSLPPSHAELLRSRDEPILIVEYDRYYYEARALPLRMTVDTGLTFYPQASVGPLRRRFPVRVPELVVVEGKAPMDSEYDLRELLMPLEPWVTRSSKYVLGCRSLGLLPGSYFG